MMMPVSGRTRRLSSDDSTIRYYPNVVDVHAEAALAQQQAQHSRWRGSNDDSNQMLSHSAAKRLWDTGLTSSTSAADGLSDHLLTSATISEDRKAAFTSPWRSERSIWNGSSTRPAYGVSQPISMQQQRQGHSARASAMQDGGDDGYFNGESSSILSPRSQTDTMTRLVYDVLSSSPATAPKDVELRRRMQQLEVSQHNTTSRTDRSTGSDSGTSSIAPSDGTLVGTASESQEDDEDANGGSRRVPERSGRHRLEKGVSISKMAHSFARLSEEGSPEKQHISPPEDKCRHLRDSADSLLSMVKTASGQDGLVDGKKQQAKGGGVSQSKSHDTMASQNPHKSTGGYVSNSQYPSSGRRSSHRHHSGHQQQRRSSDMSLPQDVYYRTMPEQQQQQQQQQPDLSNFAFPDNMAMYDYGQASGSAMALPAMDFNQQMAAMLQQQQQQQNNQAQPMMIPSGGMFSPGMTGSDAAYSPNYGAMPMYSTNAPTSWIPFYTGNSTTNPTQQALLDPRLSPSPFGANATTGMSRPDSALAFFTPAGAYWDQASGAFVQIGSPLSHSTLQATMQQQQQQLQQQQQQQQQQRLALMMNQSQLHSQPAVGPTSSRQPETQPLFATMNGLAGATTGAMNVMYTSSPPALYNYLDMMSPPGYQYFNQAMTATKPSNMQQQPRDDRNSAMMGSRRESTRNGQSGGGGQHERLLSTYKAPLASTNVGLFPSMTNDPLGSGAQGAVTTRSRLLEDFRNNRHPNLTFREVQGYIVEFSQDQHGSRFIQQKLERATLHEKQIVYNEMMPTVLHLMTDVFSNYVVQKFLELGTPEQKETLNKMIIKNVIGLSLQMYGCRVVQKALEVMTYAQQKEIVQHLDGSVIKLIKDQNGNHVIQKAVESVPTDLIGFIPRAFNGQVYVLAAHPYGCRVIQRILEHCTDDQTKPILDEMFHYIDELIVNEYGNYVVQHVIEHGKTDDRARCIDSCLGKMITLSQHKFASNVIEKCVLHANRLQRVVMIEEICNANGNGPLNGLFAMMKDPFGNYVVQKLLDIAEAPQRKLLLTTIRPFVPQLRKLSYGKHILNKVERYLPNKITPINSHASILENSPMEMPLYASNSTSSTTNLV